MKSAKLLIAFAGMSLCLTSCVDALNTVTNEPTDYDKWIASENKKDYNGDEKIDNTDYLIYVAFTNRKAFWRFMTAGFNKRNFFN